MRLQAWFLKQGRQGWATYPLTQACYVRVAANPVFAGWRIIGETSPYSASSKKKRMRPLLWDLILIAISFSYRRSVVDL